jgi:hypothetical protein
MRTLEELPRRVVIQRVMLVGRWYPPQNEDIRRITEEGGNSKGLVSKSLECVSFESKMKVLG